MKKCNTCGLLKDRSHFSVDQENRDGLRGKCKECKNIVARDWYQRKKITDPLYWRNKNLKRYYNITLKDYNRLLIEQGGICKACGGPTTGRGVFHVDHNHKTGEIRGLLCSNCNTAIGMVHESKIHLEKLIKYLE